MKTSMIFFILILTSCNPLKLSYKSKELQFEEDKKKVITTSTPQLSFESLQENIFEVSCNDCHGENGSKDQILSTKEEFLKNAKHVIERIEDQDRPMPPKNSSYPQVSASSLQVLKDFVKKYSSDTKTPDIKIETEIHADANFLSLKEHFFKKSCDSCHGENGTHRLKLVTKEDIILNESKIFNALLNEKNPMPPIKSKVQVPSIRSIQSLKKWIEVEKQQIPIEGSYFSLKHHLLEKSCNHCHGAGRKYTEFVTEEDFIKYAEDFLFYITDEDDPMPPSRSVRKKEVLPVSDEVLEALKEFIKSI